MQKFARKKLCENIDGSLTQYGGPYKVFLRKKLYVLLASNPWALHTKNRGIYVIHKKLACRCRIWSEKGSDYTRWFPTQYKGTHNFGCFGRHIIG